MRFLLRLLRFFSRRIHHDGSRARLVGPIPANRNELRISAMHDFGFGIVVVGDLEESDGCGTVGFANPHLQRVAERLDVERLALTDFAGLHAYDLTLSIDLDDVLGVQGCLGKRDGRRLRRASRRRRRGQSRCCDCGKNRCEQYNSHAYVGHAVSLNEKSAVSCGTGSRTDDRTIRRPLRLECAISHEPFPPRGRPLHNRRNGSGSRWGSLPRLARPRGSLYAPSCRRPPSWGLRGPPAKLEEECSSSVALLCFSSRSSFRCFRPEPNARSSISTGSMRILHSSPVTRTYRGSRQRFVWTPIQALPYAFRSTKWILPTYLRPDRTHARVPSIRAAGVQSLLSTSRHRADINFNLTRSTCSSDRAKVFS